MKTLREKNLRVKFCLVFLIFEVFCLIFCPYMPSSTKTWFWQKKNFELKFYNIIAFFDDKVFKYFHKTRFNQKN